jgi:hypothetical protein
MGIKKYLNSQKGVTPTGAIIFIIIAALLFLVVIQVGKPYLFAASYKSEIKEITKNCIKKNDNQFLRLIKSGARDRGFTLHDSDIQFSRGYDGDSLKVDLKYSYLLKLPYYKKMLFFKVSTEQFIDGTEKNEKQGVKEEQKKTKNFFGKIKEIFGL